MEFAEALRQSDVLTLHCPLTQETRHLIDAEEFQMMKREAILINTARGGLVSEEALVEALKDGVIAGAAFDVLSEEPPRRGNILLDQNISKSDRHTSYCLGQQGSNANACRSTYRKY